MADFFISYTARDVAWAEWIAFVLEEEGFKTVVQAWDFRPGANFVLEMQTASDEAKRTIMVLSPDYLSSAYAAPEWAAAFASDPQGSKRQLVPVLVKSCHPTGILAQIVHINIASSTEEDARAILLQGLKEERVKPSSRPKFPGSNDAPVPKAFPGTEASNPELEIPKLRRRPSDAERRRFGRSSYETIRDHFEKGLEVLKGENSDVDYDFLVVNANEFTSEIFVGGSSKARCSIRAGGTGIGDGITFAENMSRFSQNGYNEELVIHDDGSELHLEALFGSFAFGNLGDGFDLKMLAPREAAMYLWRRFIDPLSR